VNSRNHITSDKLVSEVLQFLVDVKGDDALVLKQTKPVATISDLSWRTINENLHGGS
jgi:hypothetical protein